MNLPASAGSYSVEYVFEAADGVLNLAFNLVGFSFGFELGIARRLADPSLIEPLIFFADPTTRSAARRPQSPFLAFRATNNIANESVTGVAVHPGSAVGTQPSNGCVLNRPS